MTAAGLYHNTLLRFLVIGGAMALVYAVLAALATSHLTLPRPLSAAGAWVLCIPFGFWLQRRVTFTASQPHRHALWLYAATQGLSIAIVATISHLLARGSFWPDLAVHLGASALAAILSYLINRRIIFPATRPAPAADRP